MDKRETKPLDRPGQSVRTQAAEVADVRRKDDDATRDRSSHRQHAWLYEDLLA